MASSNRSKVFARALLIAGVCAGALGLAVAGSDRAGAEVRSTAVNRYIGAGKCKSCHSSEETGNQYGAWEHAAHSKAFETLATPAAKEVASKLGVADPQKADQCLKCHATGHGEPAENFKKGFDPKAGVQCESCHGPGEDHMKARFKAAMSAGDEPPKYEGLPEGEIISKVPQKTCLGCHNEESPSFKAFCFYKKVQEVRHLNPLRKRTPEELAAMLVCGCADPCPCVNGCDDHECGVPPKEGDK